MKINIHFYIYLLFACCAFINDIIIYFFNISYNVSILISLSILLIFNIIFIKNKKILIELNWNKLDIFVFIFFIVFTLTRGIVYPEYTYDSVSYHIYLQEYFPIDKVNFDFFAPRVYCGFLFPLGDRMYFIIRNFCGLRFGTFLSFYTIIVIYYQTKEILNILTNNSKRVPLYSYLIFLTMTFIRNVGTYYIDNMALIFLLEIFYIIISNKNLFKNKIALYSIMLISGISIGIKITSVCFIIVMFVYILYRNIKNIKDLQVKDIIISIILLLLPFFVYMIDNYNQVGSILFPYYNEIFKSKYFANYNWVDCRFGIKGILNKIIWPIILGFKFGEYGDELIYFDPMFGISFIVCFIYLIKNKTKLKEEAIIVFFLLDFIWIIVMYGYHRYGVFIIVLCNILFISILIEILDSRKDYKEDIIVYKVCVVVIAIIGLYAIIVYTNVPNLKYMFKDIDKKTHKIEIDGVWGAPYDNCCYVSLVREKDTPIYNLHKDYFLGADTTISLWEDKVLNSDKEIYTIIDYYGGDFEKVEHYRNILKDGFEIKEIVNTYTANEIPYINANSIWILVKLKYVGNSNSK